jgi:hypothetical protein
VRRRAKAIEPEADEQIGDIVGDVDVNGRVDPSKMTVDAAGPDGQRHLVLERDGRERGGGWSSRTKLLVSRQDSASMSTLWQC